MQSWLIDLSIVYAFWLLLFLSYCGWGKLAVRVLRLNAKGIDSYFLFVWIGWAISLFTFNLINIFIPINWISSILFFGSGCILFLYLYKNHNYKLFDKKIHLIHLVGALFFLLVITWLASKAMMTPSAYDSGLYHFNSVKWINECRAVPGLGNLHGRLAFNDSFFTYVASLNLYPVFGKGHHIANSFLLLLIFMQSYFISFKLIIDLRKRAEVICCYKIANVLLLPGILYVMITSSTSSPNPDVASTIIQIVIFILFVRLIERKSGGDEQYDFILFCMVLLSATAVTLKLSNLVFAGMATLIVLFCSVLNNYYAKNFFKSKLLPTCFISFLIIIVWMIRGVISSGYPLYPSTLFGFNFDWSISKESVKNMNEVITAWARKPRVPRDEVLGNFSWIFPWVKRNLLSYGGLIRVLYPSILALLFASYALFAKISISSNLKWLFSFKSFRGLLYLLPAIAGILFWFFSAPGMRFINGIFIILPVAAFIFLFDSLQQNIYRGKYYLLVLSFFFINLLFGLWFLLNVNVLERVSLRGFEPVREVELKTMETEQGFLVLTPVEGDQVWDAPVPSTPYFNKGLELRGNNICEGFVR